MNKRPFLLGLGIGLIVGAALLQLMIVGQQQAGSLDNYNKDSDSAGAKLYSQEEFDKKLAEESERIRAEEQQKARTDKTQGEGTQDQKNPEEDTQAQDAKEPKIDEQAGEAKADAGVSNNASGKGEETVVSADAAGKKEAADTSANTPKAQADSAGQKKSSRTIVRIVPGSDLTETAALLNKHGVIDSQKQFITLMRKESNKIRAGYFAFEDDLTLQQVKKIVTGQPMDPEAAEKELKR